MGESEWTRKVCESLMTAGAVCIANVMGKMSSHVPDRSIVCLQGNFFVEFKHTNTRVRDGQRILMERINSRFPCAFVYRYPDMLTIGTRWRRVDALTDPHEFLNALQELQRAI